MKKVKETQYVLDVLGQCPECGSWLIGCIEPGYRTAWYRNALRFYQQHRGLLRYVSASEWDKEVSANRFCPSCFYEWREESDMTQRCLFGKRSYVTLVFPTEESYEEFLNETEFSFEICVLTTPVSEGVWKRRFRFCWNSFFGRIHKI